LIPLLLTQAILCLGCPSRTILSAKVVATWLLALRGRTKRSRNGNKAELASSTSLPDSFLLPLLQPSTSNRHVRAHSSRVSSVPPRTPEEFQVPRMTPCLRNKRPTTSSTKGRILLLPPLSDLDRRLPFQAFPVLRLKPPSPLPDPPRSIMAGSTPSSVKPSSAEAASPLIDIDHVLSKVSSSFLSRSSLYLASHMLSSMLLKPSCLFSLPSLLSLRR